MRRVATRWRRYFPERPREITNALMIIHARLSNAAFDGDSFSNKSLIDGRTRTYLYSIWENAEQRIQAGNLNSIEREFRSSPRNSSSPRGRTTRILPFANRDSDQVDQVARAMTISNFRVFSSPLAPSSPSRIWIRRVGRIRKVMRARRSR